MERVRLSIPTIRYFTSHTVRQSVVRIRSRDINKSIASGRRLVHFAVICII